MDDYYHYDRPRLKKPDGPAGGVVVFFLAMGLMIFVAAPVQYALGMWGLVITEAMMLGLAVLAAGAGDGLKRTFPLAMPKGRQIGGTLLLWMGYLGLALAATMATAYFFPEEVYGASNDIGQAINSFPFIPALLVSAVMPAICEEGLFRGYIQHSFRGVKSKWVAIIIVAAMFGIMHLSVYRLAPTFILGIGLCYLRSRSENMALPMIMHFINNAFSVMAGYISTESASEAVLIGDMQAYIPTMVCFYALASPMLIFIGTSLFNPPRLLGERRSMRNGGKPLVVAVVLTIILLVGFIMGLGSLIGDAGFIENLPAEVLVLLVRIPGC